MDIGIIGLGKLGFPVALAIDSKGHNVIGYDINPKIKDYLNEGKIPYLEEGVEDLIPKSQLKIESIETIVKKSELIFVAVQTPHDELYEGVTRIPNTRADFNYKYLKDAIFSLSEVCKKIKKIINVAIISTVLPGTIEREIIPIKTEYIQLAYNPYFIAMGTTISDFINPEFVLLGASGAEVKSKLLKFYKSIHEKKIFSTTIENAELIKVSYNTFISTKIAFANTLMEVCSKLPNLDVDNVVEALSLADQRIISPAYLKGGMGDGGGCHPRDNIALSWLSRELNLSFDFFESIMMQREKQTEWLVSLIEEKAKFKKNIYILGRSFKPKTNIQTGSPAKLLCSILEERNISFFSYDPYIDLESLEFLEGVYFIATKHPNFKKFEFPKGSIIIDPFRYIDFKEGCEYIPLGKEKL